MSTEDLISEPDSRFVADLFPSPNIEPRKCGFAPSILVLHYTGLPIDARSVSDDVLAHEGFEVAKKTDRVGGGMLGGE